MSLTKLSTLCQNTYKIHSLPQGIERISFLCIWMIDFINMDNNEGILRVYQRLEKGAKWLWELEYMQKVSKWPTEYRGDWQAVYWRPLTCGHLVSTDINHQLTAYQCSSMTGDGGDLCLAVAKIFVRGPEREKILLEIEKRCRNPYLRWWIFLSDTGDVAPPCQSLFLCNIISPHVS